MSPVTQAYRSFHDMVIPWWLHLLWLTVVVWLIWRSYRRYLEDRRQRIADAAENAAEADAEEAA
jgi:flagellar biosynthesis/type III secretory pathway M-ring protein FliF/YscJ